MTTYIVHVETTFDSGYRRWPEPTEPPAELWHYEAPLHGDEDFIDPLSLPSRGIDPIELTERFVVHRHALTSKETAKGEHGEVVAYHYAKMERVRL